MGLGLITAICAPDLGQDDDGPHKQFSFITRSVSLLMSWACTCEEIWPMATLRTDLDALESPKIHSCWFYFDVVLGRMSVLINICMWCTVCLNQTIHSYPTSVALCTCRRSTKPVDLKCLVGRMVRYELLSSARSLLPTYRSGLRPGEKIYTN